MTAYTSYNSKHQRRGSRRPHQRSFQFSFRSHRRVFGFRSHRFPGYRKRQRSRRHLLYGFCDLPGCPIAVAGGAQFWKVLFFFTLFLLGIGSAFSLIECRSTTLKDSRWLSKYPGQAVSGVLCVIGIMALGLYASDIGIHVSDAVNTFISNIGMIFLGLVKAWAAGTWYNAAETCQRVGKKAFLLFNAAWIIGPAVGTLTRCLVSFVGGMAIGWGKPGLALFCSALVLPSRTTECQRFMTFFSSNRSSWYR